MASLIPPSWWKSSRKILCIEKTKLFVLMTINLRGKNDDYCQAKIMSVWLPLTDCTLPPKAKASHQIPRWIVNDSVQMTTPNPSREIHVGMGETLNCLGLIYLRFVEWMLESQLDYRKHAVNFFALLSFVIKFRLRIYNCTCSPRWQRWGESLQEWI